jgi:hypothetical protein
MKTFTRWFVINAVITTALIAAWKQNAIQTIIANDASYIALVCMALYVGFSLYLGKISLLIDKGEFDKEILINKMQPAYFMAEMFLTLGLLGTTAGLAYTIQHTLGQANTDPAKLMKALPDGVGRTLYTTITAIASQILLQVQLFILERKIK